MTHKTKSQKKLAAILTFMAFTIALMGLGIGTIISPSNPSIHSQASEEVDNSNEAILSPTPTPKVNF